MRDDDRLVIRSGFRRQSLVNRAMGLGLWVLLPSIVFGTFVYALVEPGPEEAWDLALLFTFGAAWTAYAFAETRPVIVAVDARGVTMTDAWRIRRIPNANVARLCGVREHGRLRVAVRIHAGSLLTLNDEFAEEDKARFFDVLARAVAPHGVAVETPAAMPWDLFGFVDADAIRRAGDHRRRASAWAVLVLGFASVMALLVFVGIVAYERGERILLFVLPPFLTVFALLGVGVIARRDVFFPIALLLFGGFIVFLLAYPAFAEPFWTGPGPNTLPWWMRAAMFVSGVLCLAVGYAYLRHFRKRHGAAA